MYMQLFPPQGMPSSYVVAFYPLDFQVCGRLGALNHTRFGSKSKAIWGNLFFDMLPCWPTVPTSCPYHEMCLLKVWSRGQYQFSLNIYLKSCFFRMIVATSCNNNRRTFRGVRSRPTTHVTVAQWRIQAKI